MSMGLLAQPVFEKLSSLFRNVSFKTPIELVTSAPAAGTVLTSHAPALRDDVTGVSNWVGVCRVCVEELRVEVNWPQHGSHDCKVRVNGCHDHHGAPPTVRGDQEVDQRSEPHLADAHRHRDDAERDVAVSPEVEAHHNDTGEVGEL